MEEFGVPTWRQGQRGFGQFADDGLQRFGVKKSRGLGEGAQGGTRRAEFVLNVVEATGLLDGAEAGKEWVEEGQQDKRGVMVEEEASIAGVIACGADLVEGLQEGLEAFEVLESLNVPVGELVLAFPGYEGILWPGLSKWRVCPAGEDIAAFMPTAAKRAKRMEMTAD